MDHQSNETSARPDERAEYFSVPGAHLYTVLHRACEPIARVLMVGPFASERHFSYFPWVRWARYLAARRIEVVRYDYRGIGESTGAFEEMSFPQWMEDVQLLAQSIAERLPKLPLVLHGLELGAILAGRTFDSGVGEALLLWSPPSSANDALRSSIVRWAKFELLFDSGQDRRSAAQLIRQLEQGFSLEVQGYMWSSQLWTDSFHFEMPSALADAETAQAAHKKPVLAITLDKAAAPLVKSYAGHDQQKDFSWLYSSNYLWIAEALALQVRTIE